MINPKNSLDAFLENSQSKFYNFLFFDHHDKGTQLGEGRVMRGPHQLHPNPDLVPHKIRGEGQKISAQNSAP